MSAATKLTIADRSAELILDMTSWEEIEETVGTLDEFDELMTGRQRLRNIRAVVAIMAQEANRLGQGDEMPADWLKENMKPGNVQHATRAIRLAISEGMRLENKKGDDQATDLIMAEIEKKETQDD